MKFETLITRYKNLGYEPKNIENEIELECLINWIYKKYDIFIYLMYHDYVNQKAYRKHISNINMFSAHHITYCNTDYSNKFYSNNYFKEPFDAKFDTVKDLYRGIKFNYK